MTKRLKRVSIGSLAFITAATGLLVAFAFAPLYMVLRAALSDTGAVLLTEWSSPETQATWAATLGLSLAVTAIAVPIGTTLAWALERTDLVSSKAQPRVSALFALPLAVPPYLLAMAWALLGNGRNGLINRPFDTPWIDLYGFDGIGLVLVTASYPFVMLAVKAALQHADPSLEEAARISGAGPFQVFWSVTLPLVAPAMLASAGLVFVFTAAAFGVPYLLGSVADPPVYVLTTQIFRYTTVGGADMLARAAALAILLLATSLLAQGIAHWGARRRSAVQVSGKTARASVLSLGRARTPLRTLLLGGGAVFIVLPLLTILWTSVLPSFAEPTRLTSHHWQTVLSREETLRAFGHSVTLAIGAGIIVTGLGLVVARIAEKLGRPGEIFSALAASPYAVPGTVLAIGFLLTFAVEYRLIVLDQLTFALYLPGTLGLLLVAYAVKYLAFGVRGLRAALSQIHPSLEEAARTSGASPLTATKDVVIPLVSPAALATFMIVALPCLSELTMSVLLFGAGTETAGTLLFELQSYADPPAASVVATLVVAIALAQSALLRRLRPEETSS